MSWIALCWTGERVDPNKLNPYLPKREKSKEERELENEEGWALLRAGLKQVARAKRG